MGNNRLPLRFLYKIFQNVDSDKEDPNIFSVRNKSAKRLLFLEDRGSWLLPRGCGKPSVRTEGKY